jgi:hypothetical protein
VQVYQAHAAAAVVIFSMIVILSISFLFCSKNYIRYILLCRAEDRVLKAAAAKGDGIVAPPKAVRLRDSGVPGTILRSLDSGISWIEVSLPTASNVVGAKAPSPDEMYVLDSEGCAFKSVDFGEVWILDPTINSTNFHEL